MRPGAVAARCALGLALAFAAAGCGASSASKTAPSADTAPMRTVADIIASESPSLLAIPGVVAVREGTSEGRACIVVYVDKVTPEHKRRIPSRLQNVPVVIEAANEARALE